MAATLGARSWASMCTEAFLSTHCVERDEIGGNETSVLRRIGVNACVRRLGAWFTTVEPVKAATM
uniref:Uncharacterized protein n=1 Tax=Oryza meridionalis TaxID=40149 RepID=A0A0E0EVH4_9ORYZ